MLRPLRSTPSRVRPAWVTAALLLAVGAAAGITLAPGSAAAQPPPAGFEGQRQPQQPQGQPQPQPQSQPYAQPQAQPYRPQTSPPPRRPQPRRVVRRDHWGFAAEFGLARYMALGDRNFGLRNSLGGQGIEFEDSVGFDIFLGARSPSIGLDFGLRLGFGFGPLNRTAWEDELGLALESSMLFTIGPSLRWAPFEGSRVSPYVGLELLYTSTGTSQSANREVCDIDGFCVDENVDVPHVNYSGFSFGYLAGVRFRPSRRGARWYFFAEARYLQTSWSSLEIDPDGFGAVEQPDDLSSMRLDHVSVQFGIGAAR